MAKEKITPEIDEEIESADAAEVRVYELGFHLDPELPQETIKQTYQAIRGVIAGAGTIVAEGEPTKVPLSYTISIKNTAGRRDFDSAYFCWVAYEANGAGHSKVVELAGENKSIIRFIDLRTTKEGAKHSADMHEIFANAALLAAQNEVEEEVTEEEVPAQVVEEAVA